MNKLRIASRATLIGTNVFGIYSICNILKPHVPNDNYYLAVFIALFILSFGTIIDWETQAKKK